MTENMKEWLRQLYLDAAEEHRCAASNENIWALGSDGEASTLHIQNSMEHISFANLLTNMSNEI